VIIVDTDHFNNLKIASIALEHDAILRSAHTRDISQVPDLRCDDWLRE
jgi:predicted nucleic acid-binding protein